jgi:tetratricopeptide (TPR) repeat protein
VDDPVSLVDLTPTIASLTGAAPPEGMDGADLSGLLRGTEAAPARAGVYLESLYAYRHYGWAPQHAFVGKENKLIRSTVPELYAQIDRTEVTDLADAKPLVLKTLVGELEALEAKMVPATGVSEKASLSSDRMQQLAALGYVTAVAPEAGTPTDSLPDPKSRLPFLAEVERTRQALQEGDLKKARERAEAALSQEPNLTDLQTLYAQILLQDKDPKAALKVLEPLASSGSAQVLASLGSIHLMMGERDLALGELELATRTDPFLAQAWVPYLHLLFLSGDVERFLPIAIKAGGMFPKEPAIQGMYGLALVLGGNIEQARPVLTWAIGEDPLIPFVNHALGVLTKDEGNTAEAEGYLQEEVRLHPPAIPARRTLVEIYAGEARYAEQLEQLDAIKAVGAPDVLTLHSRAQALFNLGRYPEAHTDVEACRKLAPDYPACALLEANVLKKLGKEEEALAAYDTAVKLAQAIDPAVKGKALPEQEQTDKTATTAPAEKP